ncbi:flavoprotein [Saccharopolyspora sp. HNM0983]|uniref:Flavoprotein n=1 Tax=Saccharopolyspora montiporae TaxID=2781240 RepID=A0A929B661_9PSEU|nr:flavoprotein [Saccharopolyspora sp. HNM0983]MBE9372976.1 flavoprotein [Saccharopolyspora sp. HNM0983]
MTRRARCVYLVAAAAPPILRIEPFLTALRAEGWTVALIATPTAATWIDLDALAAATDCATRVHPRPPREPDSLPPADAVVAAPMTFNSINKWSAGMSDTLALGVLNEMLGADVPVLTVPCVKTVLRKHPAYAESIRRLTGAGATVLNSDAVTVKAEDGLATFRWAEITSALHELTGPA